MISFRLINKNISSKLLHPSTSKYMLQTYYFSSESDEEKFKADTKLNKNNNPQKSESLQKLHTLLQQMIEDESNASKLHLAKPKSRIRSNKNESDAISAEIETVEQKVVFAAKNVAQAIGENKKQTESELLSKLLNTNVVTDENTKSKSVNLSDVISGMKIDRTVKSSINNEVSRAHQVRQLLDRTVGKQRDDLGTKYVGRMIKKSRYSPQSEMEKIDLFGAKSLGIFTSQTKPEKSEEETVLKIWNALQERELRLAVTHPPGNYFQEMILWTEQGKVWKFPIDNEQDMEVEQTIYFAEHIFLEKHLESWCPTKGPIRHFMELVCVGLSKNPYLSAQAKKDHIMWFKDYFLSKKQLLEEIGAMPTVTKISKEIEQ